MEWVLGMGVVGAVACFMVREFRLRAAMPDAAWKRSVEVQLNEWWGKVAALEKRQESQESRSMPDEEAVRSEVAALRRDMETGFERAIAADKVLEGRLDTLYKAKALNPTLRVG